MTYYTYCHMTADTKQVFYYGKGKGRRAFILQNRNQAWHDVVDQHGFDAFILAKWETEKEALLHEKFLIWCARDMGISLVNICSGGGGASGSRHWLGKKHKESSKEKIRLGNLGAKRRDVSKMKICNAKIRNPSWKGYWITPDGKFDTCAEAAKHHSVDTRTIRARCQGYKEQLVNCVKQYPPREGWSFEPKEK